MNEKELKERTKRFALRVMKLVDALPNSISGRAIANQLVRAGTSVGANYRAACRGRSKAEFASKLGTVLEEADECCFWLELIMDGELLPRAKVEPLRQEANELTAIFVASIRTTKSSISNQKSKINNLKSKMERP
ncbi:four helix bundle protein [Desulfoferrobacter suflitae]|uniref:four helix bundle protein n=1 Tax=Desulfoferrobacter suflitae TaxID=2865782 RepID=UPI002164879A|nr:four helix bundle protein [Desulfoferrobacter suflitae]MCK8604083.1 four helix bundle protein [Desulfoferrobacter suflitae]